MGIINPLTCNSADLSTYWDVGLRAIWKSPLISSPSDTPGSVLNIAAGTISKFGLPPWSWRRAMMNLSLALGLAVAGTYNDASALDVGPVAQAPQWCLFQRGSNQPTCYENLITCIMAALAHTGSCSQRPSVPPSKAATTQRAPAIAPVSRHRTHASSPHKFSAAERDELFREFQKWQAPAPHE
jgi:hypothetical protein